MSVFVSHFTSFRLISYSESECNGIKVSSSGGEAGRGEAVLEHSQGYREQDVVWLEESLVRSKK